MGYLKRLGGLQVEFLWGIVMKGMASIQSRTYTFRKQKANHCPPFLLGADRQGSCHVQRFPTLQRLRGKTRCLEMLLTNPFYGVEY
ncbi:hypothetical protein TNCV_4846201 [Trichonephila clavipes]|uniref:Uncharacterized protein n=1 Tax=Trichonephila clavipes TaxID=2585209 RepID=A0A8X6WJI9_TRICX|nr:hypothetical protein TNCV_4846201 [Trichonephila clavipes]